MLSQIASAFTAVVSLLMAVRLGSRWRLQPRAHTLVYTVALGLMALAAALDLTFGLLGAWPPAGYALYWLAASGLVITMGTGAAYMANRRLGQVMLVLTVLLAAWTASLAFGPGLPAQSLDHGPMVALQAPAAMKSAFRASSYLGALLLLGTAIWSWVRTKAAYNAYFVTMPIAFTLAGVLGGRMESPVAFYLLQVLGAFALYLGVSASLSTRQAVAGQHLASR